MLFFCSRSKDRLQNILHSSILIGPAIVLSESLQIVPHISDRVYLSFHRLQMESNGLVLSLDGVWVNLDSGSVLHWLGVLWGYNRVDYSREGEFVKLFRIHVQSWQLNFWVRYCKNVWKDVVPLPCLVVDCHAAAAMFRCPNHETDPNDSLEIRLFLVV